MKQKKNYPIAILVILFTVFRNILPGQTITDSSSSYQHLVNKKLSGFVKSPFYNELVSTINYSPEVKIQINAPEADQFLEGKPVGIVFFALPNGNTTEQTIGRVLKQGDDWHYDIQHIGAQTRFLRSHISEYTIIVVYLETVQKSWPQWRAKYQNNAGIVKGIVDSVRNIFSGLNPFVILSGHSGGGGFTFSYLNSIDSIPDYVKRISFLDSDYNYDDTYGNKIAGWLNSSQDHSLSVIAYNDSVALLDGKPIVSATGGTWYRSKMMQKYLSNYFPFKTETDSNFIKYRAMDGRVSFLLKQNPERKILHTVQVELNGFIQGISSGTVHEEKDYSYFGTRAYSSLIQPDAFSIKHLNVPSRKSNSLTGSEFMRKVQNMSFEQREAEIYNEISQGNIPDYLRNFTTIQAAFNDARGNMHLCSYDVLPDYLAIGSNEDFCRIPMGPITAQRLATLLGCSMPTSKLVDDIYSHAEVRLAPVTYVPVGNANELVSKFAEHNQAIEVQRLEAGARSGAIVGGIKKDVILSNKIIDPARPHHVVIYGWHKLDGNPIQPVTNIHIDSYVDYSHGIRLISSDVTVDGSVVKISKVLTDTLLYKLFSNESSAMLQPGYLSSVRVPAQPGSDGYNLFQNYPNPFNPLTKIHYSIARAGLVTLDVFDILGREVARLVDHEMAAGSYEIKFNAEKLPGGIYFYRLLSGDYADTKKLVLLK